jgi:hypothetical protein
MKWEEKRMKWKILGIFVCTLLITTALPAIGKMEVNQSKLEEQPEQEFDNENINIIFNSGVGFKVDIQNLKNETITVYTITNQTKKIGYLAFNQTIHGPLTIGPYGSKKIRALPVNGVCIAFITVEVYDDATMQLIGRKRVDCLVLLVIHVILQWTAKWY